MKRRVHLIAALLLCLTFGLHWVVLQSVAWTTMVIERTCSTNLRSALATTFDGQHPCRLCEVVQAGKSVGETPKASVQHPKLEIFAVATVTWGGGGSVAAHVAAPAAPEPASRSDAPPLPPPRLA